GLHGGIIRTAPPPIRAGAAGGRAVPGGGRLVKRSVQEAGWRSRRSAGHHLVPPRTPTMNVVATATNPAPRHDIADIALAEKGKKRILWADHDMPVLARIRERFDRERPLAGLKMAA